MSGIIFPQPPLQLFLLQPPSSSNRQLEGTADADEKQQAKKLGSITFAVYAWMDKSALGKKVKQTSTRRRMQSQVSNKSSSVRGHCQKDFSRVILSEVFCKSSTANLRGKEKSQQRLSQTVLVTLQT